MAYRIVEITKPAECHVNNHQLIVEQEDVTVQIPVEDIKIILCIGAKIRFSTMGAGRIKSSWNSDCCIWKKNCGRDRMESAAEMKTK